MKYISYLLSVLLISTISYGGTIAGDETSDVDTKDLHVRGKVTLDNPLVLNQNGFSAGVDRDELIGDSNFLIGNNIGLEDGYKNIIIGNDSASGMTGDNNVMIGNSAGFSSTLSNSLFIGNFSGYGVNESSQLSGSYIFIDTFCLEYKSIIF